MCKESQLHDIIKVIVECHRFVCGGNASLMIKRNWRKDLENVEQAKESFNRILDYKMYASIIRDDKHLSVLLDLIECGNYQMILDIGTGTGYLAFPLSEVYSTAVVYGIDIAENIIEKNNELVKEKGIRNLVFQAFDGLKYPFDDESFDLIVTLYAFHCKENRSWKYYIC